MVLLFLSVSFALCVSFFCSLMEATLLSLTPSQVADLSQKHPHIGRIWQRFKANIERPIAVILTLNTAAHTMGASFAGAQFDQAFGSQYIWLFSLIFTFLMLQYTEILAKTLGVQFNRQLATVIARPLSLAIVLFSPLIAALHLLNRPFERKRTGTHAPATVEEIASLAAMARHSQHIDVHQERIIKRAVRLSQTPAEQCMIPLEQVVMLSNEMALPQAIVAAHIDAHTRFPVCDAGHRQLIVGYVNFKEMVAYMSTNPADPSMRGIIRPILSINAASSASDLLRAFIDQHEHIAIVRSSSGEPVGLITLEDLVEELVGELQDEFDRLPHHIHALSGGTWMFGGGVPLSEVRSRVGLSPESATGTLAAWVDRNMTPPLKPGQVLNLDGLELVIRRVRRGRVFEASIRAQASSANAAAPSPSHRG